MTMLDSQSASDGVRLLSHRPSVLYKVEHMATEPVDGDIAVEGLVLAGPAWPDRLKDLLAPEHLAQIVAWIGPAPLDRRVWRGH